MKHSFAIFHFALVIAAALLLPGCADLDKSGVYQGDQIAYDAELAITTSYDLLHTFVTWEKENRNAITQWPEIRKAADNIRLNAKQWIGTANALHDAYVANPSPENRDNLQTALAVLRTALTQATSYMVTATATPK